MYNQSLLDWSTLSHNTNQAWLGSLFSVESDDEKNYKSNDYSEKKGNRWKEVDGPQSHDFEKKREELLFQFLTILTTQEFGYDYYVSELRKIKEMPYKYAEEIYKRISFLVFPPAEEKDEDWPEVDINSLKALVEFFYNYSKLFVPNKKPNHVLTDRGNLRSVWRISDYKFLGIEFMPNGIFRFVIFSPSSNPEKKCNFISGDCDRGELDSLIRNYSWLK